MQNHLTHAILSACSKSGCVTDGRCLRMTSDNRTQIPEPVPALRDLIPKPLDHKVVWILILTALILTASHYFGHYARSERRITQFLGWCGLEDAKNQLRNIFSPRLNSRGRLWQLHYWAGAHTILYLAIPALMIKLVFREKLSDYGLKFTGWYKRLWVYVAAFGVVLPFIIMFRGVASFQRTYPFYKNAGNSWADFLGWECAYILQFLALEFFFRGFLVHGLKQRFGYYAVFIMSVPYCMIHFGKPLPETIGAIIAGILLGTLSLWTRSIWLGVLIHVTVAVAMDLAALSYRGELDQLFGIMSTEPM